jgi:hypothetical protein
VDVYLEGVDEPVITDLAYGEASEYLDVDEGDYNFQIRASGSPSTEAPSFETGALTLPMDAKVTALAAGLLGSTEDDDKFRVLPLFEGFDLPSDGEAVVRIVHAGADAPTVDLDVDNDGSLDVEDFERFKDTGEAGVLLPSGTEIQIGVVADGSTVTAFTTPELPDGAELFVVATGKLADLPRQDSGFSLLAVGPDGAIGLIRQNPTVFAFHAGADAPAVDICVADTPLLEAVPFGAVGGVQVPPGAYTLDFHAAPSDGCQGDPAVSRDTPALQAGERYLAIATGELAPEGGDPAFLLAAFADAFSLDSAPQGVFQVIHAAAAPAVDVGVVDGGEIAEGAILAADLAWPGASDEVAVDAATYEIGVAAAGNTPPLSPIATFDVPVGEAARAFVVAAGDLTTEGDEEGFRLFAIDTVAFPWTATEINAN